MIYFIYNVFALYRTLICLIYVIDTIWFPECFITSWQYGNPAVNSGSRLLSITSTFLLVLLCYNPNTLPNFRYIKEAWVRGPKNHFLVLVTLIQAIGYLGN